MNLIELSDRLVTARWFGDEKTLAALRMEIASLKAEDRCGMERYAVEMAERWRGHPQWSSMVAIWEWVASEAEMHD